MEKDSYKVVIAEDDTDIIELLKLYLQNAGYRVLYATNGVEAYRLIEEAKPDICIFDIMMPEMNGYDLIKKVRETNRVPIIVLSAKNQDSDKIIGLELGADDYITKPFNPLEIVARVKSALRRFYTLNDNIHLHENNFQVGKLTLDVEKCEAHLEEKIIPLTRTEFKILHLLMKTPGRIYTKVQIYEYVNGEYFEGDENSLMVHISNLREKIETDPRKPEYIKNVRGLGYKIERQL